MNEVHFYKCFRRIAADRRAGALHIAQENKMKFVIQRVNHASVKVDGNVVGKIDKGYMVLIGISENDTKEIADKMIKKMIGLRIFEDENGKQNN